MSEELFNLSDRLLFLEVEKEVNSNFKSYLDAGKWLDHYYSENTFWQIKKRWLDDLSVTRKTLRDVIGEELEEKYNWLKLAFDNKIYISWNELENEMVFNETNAHDTMSRLLKEKNIAGEEFKGVRIVYRLNEAKSELKTLYFSQSGLIDVLTARCICLISCIMFNHHPKCNRDNLLTNFLRHNQQDYEGYVFNKIHNLFPNKSDAKEWVEIVNYALIKLTNTKAIKTEQEPKQESESAVKDKKRDAGKAEKPEKKFQPWKNYGDACFVIKDNRVNFHYKGVIKDLRLKNDSKTHKLIFLLSSGSLQSNEIKKELCSTKTKPSKIVARANELLNQKIASLDFAGIPTNIQFIKYNGMHDSYSRCLEIYERSEFDRKELEQPFIHEEFENDDDRLVL